MTLTQTAIRGIKPPQTPTAPPPPHARVAIFAQIPSLSATLAQVRHFIRYISSNTYAYRPATNAHTENTATTGKTIHIPVRRRQRPQAGSPAPIHLSKS